MRVDIKKTKLGRDMEGGGKKERASTERSNKRHDSRTAAGKRCLLCSRGCVARGVGGDSSCSDRLAGTAAKRIVVLPIKVGIEKLHTS